MGQFDQMIRRVPLIVCVPFLLEYEDRTGLKGMCSEQRKVKAAHVGYIYNDLFV